MTRYRPTPEPVMAAVTDLDEHTRSSEAALDKHCKELDHKYAPKGTYGLCGRCGCEAPLKSSKPAEAALVKHTPGPWYVDGFTIREEASDAVVIAKGGM